jgi:ParB/RepB/Spo0J family partition protein
MNAPSTIDYDRVRQEVTGRMARAGLSGHALSEATGGAVDQSGLSKFLRGVSEKLSLEYIEAIAQALGCSRPDLTGEPAAEAVTGPVRLVPWNRLIPSPQNPRTDMDADALDGLMHSILERGVLQNLRARPDGTGNYFIVSGHRRHAAVGLAVEREELDEDYPMPVAVIDAGDADALTEALIENLHREDMAPLDEAHAYERLQELNQWTGVQVAQAIGKDERYVQQRLRLLEKLSPPVLEALRDRKLSFTQARELCAADHDVQELVLGRMDTGWYRTTEELARGVKAEQDAKERREKQAANPPKAIDDEARDERWRQEAARQEEKRKAHAEAEAAKEQPQIIKVRQFNTLFRTALRARPGTVARAALLDMISTFGDRTLQSALVGKLNPGHVHAFSGLLGVAPPAERTDDAEDSDEERWIEDAYAAICDLSDDKAIETLVLAIAATAMPATVQRKFLGYAGGNYDGPQYDYRAVVPSAAAREFAEMLKVPVPADMIPPPPAEPTDGEADEDGETGDDEAEEETADVE